MEMLRIAKLNDGWIGKDKTILDQDRNMITKHVDGSKSLRMGSLINYPFCWVLH